MENELLLAIAAGMVVVGMLFYQCHHVDGPILSDDDAEQAGKDCD